MDSHEDEAEEQLAITDGKGDGEVYGSETKTIENEI